ncbi:hypothetical protein ACHAQE_010990 [Botrytis cinerea]
MAPSRDSHTVFYAYGAEKVPVTAIIFSSPKPGAEWAWLSNLYEGEFVDDEGTVYRSAENYFQAGKAWMMKDKVILRKLVDCDPNKARTEAKKILNFDKTKWNEILSSVKANALYYKYRHNNSWKQDLVNTGNRLIVDARDDVAWGSGLTKPQTLKNKICEWPGENKLGHELMEIRLYFRDLLYNENSATSSGSISSTQISNAAATVDSVSANGMRFGPEPLPVPTPNMRPGTSPDVAQEAEISGSSVPMDVDVPITSTSDTDLNANHNASAPGSDDDVTATLHATGDANVGNKAGELEAISTVDQNSEEQKLAETRARAEADLQRENEKQRAEQFAILYEKEKEQARLKQEEYRRQHPPAPVEKAPKIYDTDDSDSSDVEEEMLEEEQTDKPEPASTKTIKIHLFSNSKETHPPSTQNDSARKAPVLSTPAKRKADTDLVPKTPKKSKKADVIPKTPKKSKEASGFKVLEIIPPTLTLTHLLILSFDKIPLLEIWYVK